MITLFTLHIVNEANRKQARWVLKKNTELAREATGFVSRDILFAKKDRSEGYSIAAWESEADMDRFLRSPDRCASVPGP